MTSEEFNTAIEFLRQHEQDRFVMMALIAQVSKARPAQGSERDVRTLISRPMWNAFCRATKLPEDSEPSEWLGTESHRVFGSETVVFESDEMISVSFAMKP